MNELATERSENERTSERNTSIRIIQILTARVSIGVEWLGLCVAPFAEVNTHNAMMHSQRANDRHRHRLWRFICRQNERTYDENEMHTNRTASKQATTNK